MSLGRGGWSRKGEWEKSDVFRASEVPGPASTGDEGSVTCHTSYVSCITWNMGGFADGEVKAQKSWIPM